MRSAHPVSDRFYPCNPHPCKPYRYRKTGVLYKRSAPVFATWKLLQTTGLWIQSSQSVSQLAILKTFLKSLRLRHHLLSRLADAQCFAAAD